MGLDMYLSTSDYVGGWEHMNPAAREKYSTILDILGMREFAAEGSPSLTVETHVAYWRKANAIHAWFVKNLQDGVDECQKTEVSETDLQKLIDAAKQALERYEAGDKDGAAEILPPQGGFFFGNTDLDEYYAADLRDTIKQLEPLLKRPDGPHFYIYQSSW